MTKDTITQKLNMLRASMAETNTDLVVLGPGAYMQWLLGFRPHADERPCLLLIGGEREVFLMPALNAEGTRKHTEIPFYRWTDDQCPAEALAKALKAVAATKANIISLDETMRADFALLLLAALPNATHGFASKTVGALRMRKDAADFICLKENALICDLAMQAGFAAMRPGISEIEIAEVIRGCFSSQGARPEFSIVGSGANGAFPHHQTGNRKLQVGDAIVVDIGGRKGHFPSDMTRMVVVGYEPENYKKIHHIVECAVRAALDAAKPGVRACDVDFAAREVIAESGYGEYFVHRTGHGLGIELHEPPFITATSETILDTGMVFSIEPGIYLPGHFGIRLEEIVYLREEGAEILSELPRDVFVAPLNP